MSPAKLRSPGDHGNNYEKENIPFHSKSKAGVSIRSPKMMKKKKGLKILTSKPSLILTAADNKTVSCGIDQRKKIQEQVEKRSTLQDTTNMVSCSMIYADASTGTSGKTQDPKTGRNATGKPIGKHASSTIKKPTPLRRPATPAKPTRSNLSMMTRNRAKVRSQTPARPVKSEKGAEVKGSSEETIPGPSIQPSANSTDLAASTEKTQSIDDKSPENSNENQSNNSEDKSTSSPGVPQGFSRGPVKCKRRDSRHHSPESPACFELDMLLQGLQIVNWSPAKPIEDIDAHGDIMTMKDYAKDFYAYLLKIEQKCVCPADYLCTNEPGMPTPSMRSVLLDWLMQVQAHLNLKDETLHLAAKLIDKFQSRHPIDLDRFQLVGVGCLLLAAKYEERFAPEVALLVYLTDNSYNRQDIIDMEALVWTTLKFDLCWPTTMTFLRRILQVIAVNKEITCSFSTLKTLASYLVDLSLLSNSMTSFYPSETAASAVRLALYVLCPDVPDVWDATLTHYSNYTERQLSSCITSFAELVSKGARSRCQAPFKKHSRTYENAKLIKHLPESPIILEFINSESAV